MIQLLTSWTPIAAILLGAFCVIQRFIQPKGAQHSWLEGCDRYFLLLLGITGLLIKGVEWTLTVATFSLIAGYLVDRFFLSRRRRHKSNYANIIKEYVWVFLVIWLVRSFFVQPYRVPSGSLEPTVYPGDFLLVNQFKYGFRFPIWNAEFIPVDTPKRGDITVFHYPKDPNTLFVKRVIGLPGDHIQYQHKKLFINGKEIKRKYVDNSVTLDNPNLVELWDEYLNGVEHQVYVNPRANYGEDVDTFVPKDHYFVMGDNRDGSHDSRHWGFVSRSHLVGKAMLIWLSIDDVKWRIRFNRIGTWI